ncbi:hypothetical protein ACHAWC_001444 [Mediolabrus comicus]
MSSLALRRKTYKGVDDGNNDGGSISNDDKDSKSDPPFTTTIATRHRRRIFRVLTAAVITFATGLINLLSSDKINKDIEGGNAGTTTSNKISDKIDLDPILAKSLKRTSGEGWTINPEIYSDAAKKQNYDCKWIEFESTTGKRAEFCGHTVPDGVTGTIEREKRFHHCNPLPKFWEDAPKTESSIYVEIGANIGSCVMEMLLSTDAKIIAFEPHPRNLFSVQKSISKLDKSYQDRVVIVPVALGEESAESVIFAAEGNMGNSNVGMIVRDNGKQQFREEEQHKIRVERLDSILDATSSLLHVSFMKLDAQGFECHIVNGMSQELANKIHKIKFEVSLNHLRNQKCTDLLTRFRSRGFSIKTENEKRKIEGDTDQFRRMHELIAVHE